jgi:glycosyltransferase involved in cell wall biosynthesis
MQGLVDRELLQEALPADRMAVSETMNPPPKVSVIIPAFNEARSIAQVVNDILRVLDAEPLDYEVLVVDDGSTDSTAELAEEAGATVLRRPYRNGNGSAVKNGIRHADGDIILLMDGDGQHKAEDIPRLLAEMGQFEMAVGARTAQSVTKPHRDIANKVYNFLATYIVGHHVEDLTSGFRAIDGHVARKVAYLFPNGFSYPSTCTISLFRAGYSVIYVPIHTRMRYGNSKIRVVRDGFGFLLILLRIGSLYAPMRIFLPAALAVFLPGFVVAAYRLLIGRPWSIPIVISFTAALLLFALGLISEQIALLRMSRFD